MSRLFVAGVLVLACAFVVGDTASVNAADKGGKKGKKGKKKAKKIIQDAELIGELDLIHATMKKADPIYKGHRAKAMHLINKAVGSLEKEMHARGLKDKTKHKVDESKIESDFDMAAAGKSLGTVLENLNKLKTTKHRTRAANDIKAAIKEVDLALAVVAKDKKN